MLFKLINLCGGLLAVVTSATINQVNNLGTADSENHYSYQRQYQRYHDGTPSQTQRPLAHCLDHNRYPIQRNNYPENADLNYPVKTVQRYTDSDGNVKIVTSYSNRDENRLPIYKDASLRGYVPNKIKSGYHGNYVTHPPNIQINPFEKLSTLRSLPAKQEYTSSKTIRFPENDDELVAREYETTVKDGNSSKYNQQSSYNTRYKKPEHGVVSKGVYRTGNQNNHKEESQPLQGASSVYFSGVDDGFIDGVRDHGGSGTYHNTGYDYGGGINSHITHGPIITHSPIIPHIPHTVDFSNDKGKSYSHSQHEEKGDKGGKGHKNYESYSKGHGEKHGHEENKGGHVTESGEKTGHHDEENHFAKGHTTSSGHKDFEKEQTKGHKKGHKTKGFRTVHHKDEYKKDEIFYDEEHDTGDQKDHGYDQTSHEHAKGGKTNKGHLNSGYKGSQKDYHGDKEEGHSYDSSRGHAGHEGHSSHHSHNAHHSKGSGHTEGEVHGHAE